MTTLFLVLLIIAVALLVLIIIQLKSIGDQVSYINKEDKTNKRIRLAFHGFFLDYLVSGINKLIDRSKAKEEDLEYEKEKIKNQITSISHDLRTPLTSIVGYIDLLEKTEDREEFLSYIDIVRKKASSLQKLVVDFYDISLLEDKNYQIDLEELTPSYILEDIIMEYYKDLEDKGIDLNVEIFSEEKISSNSQALARVYGNLLSNIKNHGLKNAAIVHEKRKGKLVTVFSNVVSSKEDIDPTRLFEKFYTGQKSRSKGSSGIGMYASKVLLEKMGHKIEAHLEGDLLTITIIY